MKKFFPIFLALLALAACTSEYDKMLNEARRAGRPGDDDVFYATIEDAGAADPQTKVFADEQMRVLWNADDRISIFLNYTYNQPYRFDGNDGDNAGGFTKVPTDDELITGNPLDHIYAVYPYNTATSISNKGILSVQLPAEQHYLAHSFGKGANTMVSVTDGNMLLFKNAGGYLSFKFYGDGARVKSITLKGNNHEKLAGKAAITMAVGGLPAVKMQNDATEEITLTCADPVALGVDSEHYKEFWFVIPPTTFEQGFTVTVTDANGGVFAKTTSKSITVSRNKLNRMAPIEVVQASSSHESVDLGLSVRWATCNVGATSPEEIGDYFSWGETTTKTSFSWSTYKWVTDGKFTKYNSDSNRGIVDNKTILDLEDDAAYVNWGKNWRMPTLDELKELLNDCNWGETTLNGVKGYIITGKKAGYTSQSIFVPYTGSHFSDDLSNTKNTYLWTSSAAGTDYYSIPYAYGALNHNYQNLQRYSGLPVRPVYVANDESISVTGVTLQPKSMSLCVGCGRTLVWTVTPETATNNEVTWHSSNPAVARISAGGRVFAKSPGIATITVTTVDGGFTATCQVSVDSPMVFDYVDLGLSVNWATFNVGATSPTDFGEYFAWGETNPKDTYGWDNYLWGNGASFNKYNTSGVLLEPDDDAAAVYWEQGWRTPSAAEMEELVRDCSWNWTREGLVYGYRITSKKTGYTDKSIFLPAAGYYENGELVHVMNRGNYWSSSLISSQIDQSSLLYLSSSVRSVSTDNRSLGCPIRPVIDKISIYTKHTKGIKPVTLCVLPDGYRESEKSLFLERAKQGMDFMFNVEPYKSLKDYFTVYFLWEPSEDSGATITDGHDNIITKRNTAFGSRWGDGYHDMKADYEKVFDFVSTHCPEVYNGKVTIEDARILLLINDTRMGGVCKSSPDGTAYCMVSALPEGTWSFPTSMAASNNPEDGLAKRTLTLQEVNELYGLVHGDWKNVFLHEFGGHCIARLTDEYWQSEQDSVAVMGDIAEHSEQIPYALNISGWYDDARVPWRELLDLKAQLEASNPLYSRIGIFQGGKNAKFNRWRSEEVSCMIDNRPYFSMWQRYLITKRIKELAGQSFILSEFLSTDYPFDPIRDSGNKYIPASYEAIKILPMGPSPDFHYNDPMK